MDSIDEIEKQIAVNENYTKHEEISQDPQTVEDINIFTADLKEKLGQLRQGEQDLKSYKEIYDNIETNPKNVEMLQKDLESFNTHK